MMLLVAAMFLLSIDCAAIEMDTFDEGIEKIEDRIDSDAADDLRELGISGAEDVLGGIDSGSFWQYLLSVLKDNSTEPLNALLLMTAVLLLVSIAESYTYSLRYTDTMDMMGMTVSLFTASIVFTPITDMVAASIRVIQGASSVMTVYLPVMVGMMAFSGHAVSSGGYYAAVLSASQVISYLASKILEPLLNLILSLSVCASFSTKINLSGWIEMLSKGFKYGVTFVMSVFVAILGLNGALSGAADSVANKAAKFTLSSFIPLVGSSISEAYGTIQNSVGILRSGVGVFVILAVFVAFAPLLARTILWSLMLFAAQSAGEALSVTSACRVLRTLSQFLSALRAVLLAVLTVFIISSAIMMKLGGSA